MICQRERLAVRFVSPPLPLGSDIDRVELQFARSVPDRASSFPRQMDRVRKRIPPVISFEIRRDSYTTPTMLFTGAFTVNRWRLTIGSKTGDKLSESSDRLRLSTIENGSQTSGRGAFYGHRRRAGNASRWCITLDSYATLTLRPCVHARAICISVINVCARQMRAVHISA